MMILRYLQLGSILLLVLSGVYIKHLIGVQAVMEAQTKTTQDNLKLLVQELDREIMIRQSAELALNELYKDVSDVEYQQSLSPNIQGVLDRFHSSITHDLP